MCGGSGMTAVVVRTITIDRQDNSEVYRYDSGWQAVTPGTIQLAGVTVHPGAVLGAYNVREIRDTTQTFTTSTGSQLTAVHFDADYQIEGVVSGGNNNGLVPSTGQLGFVQISPAGSSLQAGELGELISSQGPLGGPVDCVIAVAGTAQTMRLSRVEVANAPHAGSIVPDEFASGARGSLVLPAQGSWSVLARTDNVSEPTPIDADLGVPLIRQGPAGGLPPNTPWRLADPADLWVPDTPTMDYCLLHATDSTRILFPRPKIESGATAFTSTQPPRLADGFALLGGTGICPRQDSCLTFPDANYELQISGAGEFTLANVLDPFVLPTIPARALATGAAAAISYEYQDEKSPPAPAQVSVKIAPDASSVAINGTNVRLDMTPFSGLVRVVGDLQTGSGTSFAKARLVLGSVLQPLQALITFLESLLLPDPLKVSFSNSGWTNSYKVMATAKFDFDESVGLPPPDSIELGLGFGNISGTDSNPSSQWFANLDFKIVWLLHWPPPPVPWVGIFKMDVAFPTGTQPGSETLKLQLGRIFLAEADLVPNIITGEISFAVVFTLVLIPAPKPPSFALGAGLILDAQGEVKVGPFVMSQIEFTAEADALVITTSSPIQLQFTFDVEIDVALGWFHDETFEWKWQFTQDL
jgi:hypothetical protein